jgi:transcriptional regulator with XRE-family HTH domain
MYQRIRELRESRHLTKKAVAEILHISVSTYTNYEKGKVCLRALVIARLADLYGTSTEYLLGRTDDPKPYPPSQ